MKIENDCRKIEIKGIDRNIKQNKILPRLSYKQKKFFFMPAIYLFSFHPFAKEAIIYTLDRDFQLNEVLIYYGYSFQQ